MLAGACLFLFALAAAAEEVVTLTTANFDQHLQDKKFVLAEFYAPWCGHCKKLAPEFEKAASALKSDGVSLAKVDATEEKELAKRFEVKGFPTLIWFESQKRGEYSGGRSTEAIVDWVRSMTGPAVLETTAVEPPGAEKPQVVLRDTELHGVFEEVAKENRRKASWVYQKTIGPLEISLSHLGEETVKYQGPMENESLSQFVADNAMPHFGELNGDTFNRYLEAGKGLLWSLFPADTSLEEIQKAKRPMMTEVAKKLRGRYFVTYTDTEKFKDAIDSMLGVTSFPTIAVQKKAGDKKKFLYSGEMTAEKISAFVAEVDAGKVEPAFKSQAEPEKSVDDVKVVVASTLQKEVFTQDRDVLLEVYAPWCGHCKKLEPEYIKLAKKIRKEELGDLLTIAKIDGTANDSPVDEIVSEEERLRKLEQQRRSGELQRVEKSAVDRSSEAVASKLMQPSKEIDAMDELRHAANQVELERVQRNLARLQRLGDKHGALANKVVKAAPSWVLEEARKQNERIAQKKAEKAAAKEEENSKHVVQHSELLVDCAACGQQQPWAALAEGDGVCVHCLSEEELGGSAQVASTLHEEKVSEDLSSASTASSDSPPVLSWRARRAKHLPQ